MSEGNDDAESNDARGNGGGNGESDDARRGRESDGGGKSDTGGEGEGKGRGYTPRVPGELPPERPVSRDSPERADRMDRKAGAGAKRTGDPAAPEPRRPAGGQWPGGAGKSAGSDEPGPRQDRTGRQRLAQALWPPRATRAQFIVALLLFVLGLGLAIQVRSTSENSALRGARQEDLVRILDELDGRSKRLEDEKQSLQNQRTELENSSDQAQEARKQTRQKERQLGVLAGTVGAQGPGITLTVNDSRGSVQADMLLDTVQELRAAGAEAIQVNGVRVVASTYFSDNGRGVRVDGRKISQPYRFEVIGKPQDLEPALNIPGGVVQTLRKEQAGVSVSRSDKVIVSALRSAERPHYARSSSQ